MKSVRRRSRTLGLLLFAAMVFVSAWAHLAGLSHEGIDDVDSAALYRMLTHRLPAHDLSYFGGYTD
ncbi:MAG: hypothetical protein RBU21_24295, partial [FCB group bacterium]|nr:hypothetical protein [FCB group bacterium]